MEQFTSMDYLQHLQSEINKYKYIKINTNIPESISIGYLAKFGEPLSTVYNREYCITQLVEDLAWLSKHIDFTKSFSDFSLGSNELNHTIDLETPIENDNFIISEKTPFLKYKDVVKDKYRILINVFKQVYKNALFLPDAERVIRTISNDFNIENNLYLKNPEFIIDHFIYHIYNNNHISDNYEKVVNILKVFEYLYYKTMNYVNELEFDLLSFQNS